MSEADRISPDQDESVSSEPLGIREPLRSPTALGQSRFLMPLGLRSLSVLQPIAVHPQVDDFDFSSIQAAEPTHFQEPSTPNLQLSNFSEPREVQSAPFEIPTMGRIENSEGVRPSQINSLPQKSSTSPTSPGTSRSQPVQGVVQFFKSVFGRKDSPVPEQASTPEFLPVADSPQPLSEAPTLVQLQRDNTDTSSEPPQAILSSELASSFFFDRSNTTTQQPFGSNLEIQQQAELPEEATQATNQQVLFSNLEIQQRENEEEVNASKDANFPFVSNQAPLQKNIVSLSVDSQDPILADDLGAIASTQFDLNPQGLEPQRTRSEDSLTPTLSTIQLQQEDKLAQENSPSFLQNKTLSENLTKFSEITTVETGLEESLTKREASSSKTEPAEPSQIQRQPVEQSTGSVQLDSSVKIPTEIGKVTQSALTNQQVIQPQDHAQTNQNLSVIQSGNDGITRQDQPRIQRNDDVVSNQRNLGATDFTLPLLNDVEINPLQTKQLQTKQENSFEQVSYSSETGRSEQSESIQNSSHISPKTRELEDQSVIQQPAEAPTENGVERAIAFVAEDFNPSIDQQGASQPSLQLREEHPFTETNESSFKSVASAGSITPASLPQLQQTSDWTETTASHQLISSAETLPVSQPSRYEESAILQKQSDADTPLNPRSFYDAPAISHQDASSISLDTSLTDDITSTRYDASALNSEKISTREDESLDHHSTSPIINYDTNSDPQERLAESASSDVLQLREEKAEILDLSFQESPQTPLPKDLSTSPESFPQDWDAVEVAPLSLPEIQRRAENALTDTVGAALEEVVLPEDVILLEESQLASKNAAVQNQSDIRGDRNHKSSISTNQSASGSIEPNVSVKSTSPQELDIQRYPTTENTQTTIQQNSDPIHPEPHLGTLFDSPGELEAEIATVSPLFVESETRSPQLISNESPLPQNNSILEDLSSPEIQRQLENSVSISHVMSKDFSDIEAENPLENEILPTSVNDFDASIEPSTLNYLQSEDQSETRTLSASVNNSDAFIEPLTLDSLQMKSVQADELAVASNLKNVSVSDSFELDHESSTAFNHRGSEQHLLENTFNPSTQFTSGIPSVQTASVPANDAEANSTLVEESLSETSEFVPDSVAQSLVTQSLTETAIAPSTSESLLNSASQSNYSERSELTSPLTNPAPNSSNIQRKIEPSELAVQNPAFPNSKALQAETHLDSSSQSVTGQDDNSLQNSSGASQKRSDHDLHQSPLNLENVTFPTESTQTESIGEKILSSVQPSSPTLDNLSENLPYPIVQPKHHSGDESSPLETITSSESRHSDSNIQSFVGNTSDTLNQSVSEVPTVQAISISSSGTHAGTYEIQENIAVETNNLVYSRSDSDAIAQEQHETSQSSILPEHTVGESAIASHPLENLDLLTITGEPELNIAIQQRPIEDIDRSPALAESELSSQVLSSILIPENLPSSDNSFFSAGEQQTERHDTVNHTFLESSPDIQKSERFETDSHTFLVSSPDTQPNSEIHSSDEIPIVSLSSRPVDSLFSSPSSVHLVSDIQRVMNNETIAEHKDVVSQNFLDIQLELESRPSVERLSPELSDLSIISSSEAIAQPSSEPTIAISATEPSSQAIVNTWDASSSYDSTPNGRRDAQIAALGNQLPFESEISQVLPNTLSSDIQRFVDDSSENSLPFAQLNSSAQSEIATSSSSEASANLPQLPRFLKDLTVLKPLVQRSPLSAFPITDRADLLNEAPLRSPSEAIAQPLAESAISTVESPSQAIANDGNTASSYDSTPNGRRDAQLATAQNHPPIESEISSVLPSSLSSDIQRFTEDSTESLSPSIQLDSADQSKTVTPSSSELPADLPQLPRILKNLTVLRPLVQRSPLNAFPVTAHGDLLDNPPFGSSSEAIAQPLAESAISTVESPSQAIANDGNTASSYDSTPNGRRDAQIAAAQNHPPVESERPQVLGNSLSSDIQRFIDDSPDRSLFSSQLGSSEQLETVNFPSSQVSADLPQLPRFLKNLTVLKPLVQRSFLHEPPEELPDQLPNELASDSTPRSLQNSSLSFSSPLSGNHNSATLAATAKPIAPPQSVNTQPVLTSTQTPSAPISSHPGTVPSTWSSLAELVNPKPSQPQQSSSTNSYLPLAPSLLQAKFAAPTLQKAIDSSAPVEIPNAPATTLSASDFQPEAQLDALLATLAQEIYGLLRQKMEIERERQGRSLGRMPW